MYLVDVVRIILTSLPGVLENFEKFTLWNGSILAVGVYEALINLVSFGN